jgi:tRNA(fMet)-specific endonuclease VapC
MGQEEIALLLQRLKSTVILPYDSQVCKTYATLKHTLRSRGRVLADNDLWIAACALRHKLPLVSNNRKHFEGIPGLTLISEAVAH